MSDCLAAVRFANAAERSGLGGKGTLVLRIERLGPSARGRLSDVIDEAMERELAARGAPSPGVGSTFDADAALSDQLFRARQVGVERVCLALGPMRAASSALGAMQAEDTATLLFWARATRDRPVELVLDSTDEEIEAFVKPTALKRALGLAEPGPARAYAPALAPAPDAPPAPVASSAPQPHAESRRAGGETEPSAIRHFTLALTAARGPQPLASFERLFVQAYMPLCLAVDRGVADARARQARDDFRTNFARMYTEACPTFAATGKRPRMVFDAPDVAARLARSHSARTVQLLMVPWLRFDLAALVKESLGSRLGHDARIADEVILWSALPTTTNRQLDGLVRGAETLRSPPASEREMDIPRGRTADTIRRIKTGSRDVYKLDTCDARIRASASAALDALPAVAQSVADVVARHASSLAARTLLFVFGDHGFTVGAEGTARTGGASPEEVLVPAFCILVGEPH